MAIKFLGSSLFAYNRGFSIFPNRFLEEFKVVTSQISVKVRLYSDVAKGSTDFVAGKEYCNTLPSVDLGDTKKLSQVNDDARLLKIAIIGVPNVGKSTIINQLVGRRVCSISSKVHTTRCKARAIAIFGNTQLVFLDTPGLVTSDELQRHHLERSFHSHSEQAMVEADVIGVIHDISNTWTRNGLDLKVLRLLHLYPEKHSFLVINKIDAMKSKRKLLDIICILTKSSLEGSKHMRALQAHCSEDVDEEPSDSTEEGPRQFSELQVLRRIKKEQGWSHFKEVFMVSALNGDGMTDVKDYLLHISKPSPWLYPASQYTDQASETVIVNTVKSKLLDDLPQEVPYNLNTVMEYYDVGPEGTITAVVLVGCPSLRIERFLVGSRGKRIRSIARAAEQELQNTFRQTVRLKVVVTSRSQTLPNIPYELRNRS